MCILTGYNQDSKGGFRLTGGRAMFRNKEYVYRIYKEKSFSKAAESLYISQPSLSATIKKMEQKIGEQLFDRSTNPIRLTECGEEYIKCIEKMMDIEGGFENYLSNMNELKVGRISIGAGNFFAAYILPPIITEFRSQYPAVKIDLVEADTGLLEKKLFAGELDLIIDNYEFNENIYDKHFFYSENLLLAVPEKFIRDEELWNYQLRAKDIVGNKHLDVSMPAVPLDKFSQIPFLLLRHGNDTRVRAEKILKKHTMAVEVILELDQLATAYRLCSYGMGATFISDTLVKKTRSDEPVRYFKVDSKQAKRINYFYYKQGKYFSKVMHAFLKTASQEI